MPWCERVGEGGDRTASPAVPDCTTRCAWAALNAAVSSSFCAFFRLSKSRFCASSPSMYSASSSARPGGGAKGLLAAFHSSSFFSLLASSCSHSVRPSCPCASSACSSSWRLFASPARHPRCHILSWEGGEGHGGGRTVLGDGCLRGVVRLGDVGLLHRLVRVQVRAHLPRPVSAGLFAGMRGERERGSGGTW